MNFEELQRANASCVHTDIGKGKEYCEVNQRIKAFRMLFPEGTIHTDLVSLENGVCIFRAVVMTDDGKVLGEGTAYEKEGSSFINKTSYIENCETSAVGRALAMCGIGIDTSIASYEEVANAKANQEEKKDAPKNDAVAGAELRAKVIGYCNKTYTAEQIQQICHKYEVASLNEMSPAQCKDFLHLLEVKKGKKEKKDNE